MQPPKCFITWSKDAARSPAIKAIPSHPFNHQLDLLLPKDAYELISHSLQSSDVFWNPPNFYRLHMPLGEILEPDFFTTFIKKGNIILLSQGQLDVDNIFTLNDGILRMSLNNESYERAGLQGRQAKFGNGPGLMKRRRFLVELNLRSPSYMTGSKQFNKLQRACKTVFSKPVVFLFADLESPQPNSMQSPVEALSQYTPRSVRSERSMLENVRIPEFVAPRGAVPHGGGKSEEANYHREVWRDWAMEVYEYFALLMMPDGKPADRLQSSDSVDPYLSTYVVGDQEDENSKTGDIVRISFSGVLSKGWISQVWKELEENITALGEDEIRIAWCAMTVHGFENVPVGWNETERGGLGRSGDGYTLVKMPQHGGILLYELVGGQEDHS